VAEHVRQLTPERARSIGQAALQRVLGEHTYAHRGAEVDALFKREMAGRLQEVAA
jgi:spore maturation protein CgeB